MEFADKKIIIKYLDAPQAFMETFFQAWIS